MVTGIQAQWRRRLWTPWAVARSPLSPTPCAFCSALGLRSRWRSDLSAGAPDAAPSESDTAPNPLEWLKALRRNPKPDESLRSPNYSQILYKNKRTRDKSRRRLRPPKNRPLLRPIMEYPTDHGKEQNLRSLHRTLTAQMIQEKYAKGSRERPMPTWTKTLSKLRRRTPERAMPWKRHALKIVVPDTQLKPLTEHVDDNIWDITERTTCGIELYEGVEEDGRLALLLSGDDVAIQEATDIIKGLCERVWIFRPDPFSPDAPLLRADSDVAKKRVVESTWSSCPKNLLPTRPRPQFWTRPFEHIPYPEVWDKCSFLNYIRRLSTAKLRGYRAIELYGSVGAADEALMDLIYTAFERPFDATALSATALRIALEGMAEAGYKLRPYARRLFTLAQTRRLQIDTSVFNKLLLGCVRTRDLANFDQILDFMDSHNCNPNYNTWVLFFNMLHDEGAKRQIVLAMDEIGFLHNPQATKDVANEFAVFDTYRALDSGKDATSLCREMDLSYGPTWASRGALNKMLLVCGRFERYGLGLELIEYFEREYQIVPNASTFAILLVEVKPTRDFGTALQALRLIESRYHLEKTEQIYNIIHSLATRNRLANVMAVVFAYACLEGATSFTMRFRVSRHLARPGYVMKPQFRRGSNLKPAYFAALPGYVPVELWADLYAELERDPAQEEHQGPVLAALYRSQLDGMTPTVPLADMIDKALAIDERLLTLERRLKKKKKKGSHVVSVREELGEEEFFDIPVHHRNGLGEAKVVKVPITSEALVNNHDKEWFEDATLHPRMDLLPWEVMLDGEEARDKLGVVEYVSEKWLASGKAGPVGKGKKTGWGEEKTLGEGRALKEKVRAEQGEPGLGQEGAWQGVASYGEVTPRATSSSGAASAEPINPADGDSYGEEPISSSSEAEESPPDIPRPPAEESPEQNPSISVKEYHEATTRSRPSAPVSTDHTLPTPAENKEGAKEKEGSDTT